MKHPRQTFDDYLQQARWDFAGIIGQYNVDDYLELRTAADSFLIAFDQAAAKAKKTEPIDGHLKQMEQIGQLIKKAKQVANLSNTEIAKAIGISTKTVNEIAHGRNANMNNYLQVCNVIGIKFTLEAPEPTPSLKGKLRAKRIARREKLAVKD